MKENIDNRPGSFVNQLAELYKASTITEAELQYKRCLIVMVIESDIRARNEEVIAFIGIPDLQSSFTLMMIYR